jgi:hypothetical protein
MGRAVIQIAHQSPLRSNPENNLIVQTGEEIDSYQTPFAAAQ